MRSISPHFHGFSGVDSGTVAVDVDAIEEAVLAAEVPPHPAMRRLQRPRNGTAASTVVRSPTGGQSTAAVVAPSESITSPVGDSEVHQPELLRAHSDEILRPRRMNAAYKQPK